MGDWPTAQAKFITPDQQQNKENRKTKSIIKHTR
jgi:hypothetical protein